ncbi:MAG: hypothetical protein ACRYFZ_24105 [Janthinobacterium lividum]
MFNNPFFDSIISMIVLYLVFSQLTLSLTELVAGPLNSRGRYLYDHLGTALGLAARDAFYLAAPIQALMSSAQGQNPLMRALGISRWPAYVSETLFAQTLIAHVSAAAPLPAPAGNLPAAVPVIDQFKAGLAALAATQSTLVGLLTPLYLNAMTAGTAEDQSQNLQKNIELWFREFGGRMSGWYKRDNRKWLFLAGLVVAVLADVDTVRLAHFIFDSANAKARTALVDLGIKTSQGPAPTGTAYDPTDRVADSLRRAQQGRLDSVAVKAFENTLAAVPQVSLPLGWLRWRDVSTVPDDTTTVVKDAKRGYAKPFPCNWTPSADDYGMPAYAQRWTLNKATGQIGHPAGWSWWRVLGSWLLTAFAMMLGAPFWFDTLGRFVNIRNVGIKPAKASD